MIGPAGTKIAIWPDDQRITLGLRRVPPEPVVVGRLAGSGRPADDRLFTYSGEVLMPVRWSRDGAALYVRTRGPPAERIMALDADGGGARTLGMLAPAWRRVDIAATAHGDMAALTDPAILARLGRMGSEGLIRGHASLGRTGIELLGTRRADLNLVRIGEAASTPVGINASQTRNLIAIPGETPGTPEVFYLGAPVREAPAWFPYQRVLVDLETGRPAGRYGMSRVLAWRAEAFAPAMSAFNASPDREKEVILDASRSGDHLALLLVDANGDRRIALIGPRGLWTRTLCGQNRFVEVPARPATDHRVRAFALDEAGREADAPGRPIAVLHRKGAAAADLVVYFHGGFGGSEADDFFTRTIDRLLTADRDVVSLEYSGSQGGGLALTRRLAERGMRAIEEDVAALIRWLDRQHYRRVFVLGASLGGVPALVAARHRGRFAAIFFVAPLLRQRDPGEWVQSTPIPADPETHLASELAYLGGPEGRRRFGEDLAALLAAVRLRASDRFYFAGRDRVSQPEDLPAGSPASSMILAGVHHPMIFTSSEMWENILARMR
jgi:dienelactone hydrolase